MTDQDLIDFGIWPRMDQDATAEETKHKAPEASQGAIEELREGGVGVEWLRTDVLEDPDDDTDCVNCHYRGPGEAAVREHSDRAGLPVTERTRIDDHSIEVTPSDQTNV